MDPTILNSAPVGALGGGALVALAYKIWQILRADQRTSRLDSAQDQFYRDLQEQLRLALEARDALQLKLSAAEVAAAQDSVKARLLEDRIEEMKARIRETDTLLAHYKSVIEQLTTANEQLLAKVEVLALRPPAGPDTLTIVGS